MSTRHLVAATAALALAATATATPVAHADGWARAGTVQANGGPYLTDTLGRDLQLHGVNLVAKCGGGSADLPVPGTPCVGSM